MATPPRKRATHAAPTKPPEPTAAPSQAVATKRVAARAKSPAGGDVDRVASKSGAAVTPVAAQPAAKLEVATIAARIKARKLAARVTPAAMRQAKFSVGAVVKHRVYPFRGVVFDIDPVFNNTEDWWQAIPEEIRPRKDQPFYHLLAENAETTYVAYVSEQNLLADKTGKPVRHPQVKEMFALDGHGQYRPRFLQSH